MESENFELKEVLLGDPRVHELLVEIKASGVCHTDFDSLSWGRRMILGTRERALCAHAAPAQTISSPAIAFS